MLSIHRQYTKSWLVFCPLKCIFSFMGRLFSLKPEPEERGVVGKVGGWLHVFLLRLDLPSQTKEGAKATLSHLRDLPAVSISPTVLHLVQIGKCLSTYLDLFCCSLCVCVKQKSPPFWPRLPRKKRKREKKTISQHCFNTWMYPPPHVLVCYAAASL